MQTPVALFIFNRPDLTARVIQAIATAAPPVLFVVADGPRSNHPEDERLVAEARAAVDSVDWPCEVLTRYSEVNMNCDARIASGLDWVFEEVPEAIIFEDDCLPDPTFFPFCEQLLDRYREDDRVHMVGGSNVVGARGEDSYHFSRCYPVWGWASWARAWKHFDRDMRAWPRLRETNWLEDHLRDRQGAEIARGWFDHLSHQWDFQWMFSSWLRNAVAVMPSENLVTNIGFGESATHQRDAHHPSANVPVRPMEFPLVHPPEVEVLEAADRATWKALAARPARSRRDGPWRRMAGYLAKVRRKVQKMIEARRGGLHD